MKVEADLSPYLARLLDNDQSPRKSEDMFNHLLDKADLLSDERATIKAALGACLGEDALTWDLNISQLPHELPIQNGLKLISLDWQPLYGDDGCIQNVLITVRDITARRKLQDEVRQAHAYASRIEQRLADILQIDARAAEAFVNDARAILPRLRPCIEHNSELTQCFRELHTLKGMARTLGFKEMSSLVHSLEDQLDLQNQIVRQKEEGMNILDQIEKTVREYSEIIEKIYFRKSEAAGRRAGSLLDLVATSIVPVRSMLEQTGMELAQLDIEDHVGTWNKDWLDVAQIMLMHGMTNIADHGYILPRQRGKSIESGASIQIKAWQSEGFLHLELNDKGAGLDLVQLKNLAKKLNFVPETFETVADVVFLDGASTAESVSSSSGRGMGMAALRSKIMTMQGTVNLRPNPAGKGSSLVARLPLSGTKAA